MLVVGYQQQGLIPGGAVAKSVIHLLDQRLAFSHVVVRVLVWLGQQAMCYIGAHSHSV